MKNCKLNNILNAFYKDYDEDGRLNRDKTHYVEFLTTINYIDRYLKEENRILEVGAGTGKYSLHYAKKGYQVDSLELVQSNIDVLNSHIEDNMNINITQGNALDLSIYEDNTFDITLVLGPLYHLFSKEDQEKALKEAIRVTKKDGIIYIAFILFDSSMVASGFVYNELNENYGQDKIVNLDYTPNNKEENIFNLMYLKDVKELINQYPIEVLHYVATDGIAKIIENTINNMDEEIYNHYINYHLSTCEREDLMGYSGHILSIIKKN